MKQGEEVLGQGGALCLGVDVESAMENTKFAKTVIRVGTDFQALIPAWEAQPKLHESHFAERARHLSGTPLWDPAVAAAKGIDVKAYMNKLEGKVSTFDALNVGLTIPHFVCIYMSSRCIGF